ncbi:T9SS type B sorting domain-containing protein [Ilyomonas limi]|uniref:T9SS type B sorting domain-containing protein n=1 Tax=Ilyomonas limi TaxID=2575867 RepID=A0A4U3L4L1_9BACT|nr:PKD domain-containing protein [Ilyomonas limi]TKK68497.1 T9SS type B sorting domain-containing protein [Ilyomonas limi]
MYRRILLCLILLCVCATTYARHGKGGYLIYQYLGKGSTPGTSQYKITVLHYVNCLELQFETGFVYIGVFDAVSNAYMQTITINSPVRQEVTKQTFNACINTPPPVCFYQFTYITTVELKDNNAGYILSEQECCRAQSIVNVLNSGLTGSTNTNTIPGVINGVEYRNNSSPIPALKDTAVICHNSYFQIDFGSTDPDGDELTYTFCAAEGGATIQNRQPNPPAPPPYQSIDYAPGYSGSSPLGSGVTIDSKTGLISGIAPGTTGQYVIAVCINELRNGVQIGNTKKEVLVTVADCNLTAANLKPEYINCDSFAMRFENESLSSNVASYVWDFGVPNETSDVSDLPTPTYIYKQAGTYTVKLKVTNEAGCADSSSTIVKVYPGFKPAFDVSGSCYQSPFIFTDKTYAAYGVENSWTWNFDDASSTNNISSAQNPTHLFSAPKTATITFNVTTSVGCSGTTSKTVLASDKPEIKLPFTDTLICNGDRLPLNVEATGDTYTWIPAYNISNTSIVNPVVHPADTTVYTITVKDQSCIGSANVKVNVLDSITVQLPADTAICTTDSLTFHPVSDALAYTWTESGNNQTLNSANIKNPSAGPLQNTTYFVTARLGHCQDRTQTKVLLSPYPAGNAGSDTTICFGSIAQLHGSTTAAYFTWFPAGSLLNTNTLQPTAGPETTTAYLFTVKDTFYCPKSTTDTVIVNVIAPVQVNAGNDTSVVVNQPLQLHVISNENITAYTWSPSTWLNNATSPSPVATMVSPYTDAITYTVTATTTQGCTGTDSLKIFIYTTLPDLYVPTAFTPNSDGLNDIFKPSLAGIKQLKFFRIFDRRGQLLYETQQAGNGWDGTFKGMKQPAGTYVFTARAMDYLGKTLEKKGTVVLIR